MNPFCTQFTTSLPFIDELVTLATAIKRFENADWFGQLVGPHGCGKSTLARAIANSKSIRGEFGWTRMLILRRENVVKTSLQELETVWLNSDSQAHMLRGLLLLDGIESVNPFQRWALFRNCRQRRIGLLLTTHRPMLRVPIIATLKPTLSMLQVLVEQLLSQTTSHIPIEQLQANFTPQRLETVFAATGGNLREALMLLYDDYENLRKRGRGIENGSQPSEI
jgi:replication-associated recombination protein RarA